jgi:hypothetical protein
MMPPSAGGVQNPYLAPSGAVVDEWIVILEFSPTLGDRACLFDDVEDLVERLREWRPSGLWSPGRYAIQLQVPASAPDRALWLASAYHRQAAQAAGLPLATLSRVEVLTLAELEACWARVDPGLDAAPLPPDLRCDELYTATRRLLAATTATELADTVAGFVTAAGGWVEPGPVRHLPGMLDMDATIEAGQTRHAWAESISVAGLLIEELLPVLLTDARRALLRVQGHHLEGEFQRPQTVPGTTTIVAMGE